MLQPVDNRAGCCLKKLSLEYLKLWVELLARATVVAVTAVFTGILSVCITARRRLSFFGLLLRSFAFRFVLFLIERVLDGREHQVERKEGNEENDEEKVDKGANWRNAVHERVQQIAPRRHRDGLKDLQERVRECVKRHDPVIQVGGLRFARKSRWALKQSSACGRAHAICVVCVELQPRGIVVAALAQDSLEERHPGDAEKRKKERQNQGHTSDGNHRFEQHCDKNP